MVFGKFELLLDLEEEKASVLTPDDYKRLLREAAYGRNGKRNVAIVWFSFGSALRVTEIARLKIKDIVNKDGSLKKEFRLPAAYTKNGESRLAYMLEDAHLAAMLEYLKWRIDKARRVSDSDDFLGLDPKSPLFLSRGNSGFTFRVKKYKKVDGTVKEYKVCSSLQQLLTELIKKVGVKGGSSHSGRRTFATRLADRGIDLEYIKFLLGHKSKQQTLAYIDSNRNRLITILTGIWGEL
jgi:integrase/recombinase XerD